MKKDPTDKLTEFYGMDPFDKYDGGEDVPYVNPNVKSSYKSTFDMKVGPGFNSEDNEQVLIIPKKKKKKKILIEPPAKDEDGFSEDDFDWGEDIEKDSIQEFLNNLEEQSVPQLPENEDEDENDNKQNEIQQAAGQMQAAPDIETTTSDPMGGQVFPPQDLASMGATYSTKEKDSQQIGRVYELRRIYNRMLSLEEYLSFSSDKVFLNVKKYLSESIDLFETLISNIDQFLHKIDDIVVMYYDFLIRSYEIINDRIDEIQKQDKKDNSKAKRDIRNKYKKDTIRYSVPVKSAPTPVMSSGPTSGGI